MRVTVAVDTEVCAGVGNCEAVAPRWFRLEDDVSVPLAEEAEDDDRVREAAQTCPVFAITVRDAATGEQVAPTF